MRGLSMPKIIKSIVAFSEMFFLKCCFSYFPNSHNVSIGNNQKMAEL